MDPVTIIILICTLAADLSIGGAAWLLARRQGETVDQLRLQGEQLTKVVTALQHIAENHADQISDHENRIYNLENAE